MRKLTGRLDSPSHVRLRGSVDRLTAASRNFACSALRRRALGKLVAAEAVFFANSAFFKFCTSHVRLRGSRRSARARFTQFACSALRRRALGKLVSGGRRLLREFSPFQVLHVARAPARFTSIGSRPLHAICVFTSAWQRLAL